MIKIEITDIGWIHPDELMNLSVYLKRAAEINILKGKLAPGDLQEDIIGNGEGLNPLNFLPEIAKTIDGNEVPLKDAMNIEEKEYRPNVPHDEFQQVSKRCSIRYA